jgi:hypothetical protein
MAATEHIYTRGHGRTLGHVPSGLQLDTRATGPK